MLHGKSIVIYPYSKVFAPVLRHLIYLMPDAAFYPVAPKGFGIDGQNASEYIASDLLKCVISSDIDEALGRCDELIVTDIGLKKNYIETVVKTAEKALNSHKDVHFLTDASEEIKSKLKTVAENNRKTIIFYSDEQKSKLISPRNILYPQQSTVIGIGRALPQIDTLDLTLSVKRYLEGKGYSVNAILNCRYSDIINCNSMPDCLRQNIPADRQIIEFNHYIEALEKNNRSDVILVQYPGGMQQFDEKVPSDMGAFSYIVSQAIVPDYFFCCFPFMDYLASYVDKYSAATAYKYAAPINVALLSDLTVDVSVSHETNQVSVLQVGMDAVQKKIRQLNSKESVIKWYPLLGETELAGVFDDMLEKIISFSNILPI